MQTICFLFKKKHVLYFKSNMQVFVLCIKWFCFISINLSAINFYANQWNNREGGLIWNIRLHLKMISYMFLRNIHVQYQSNIKNVKTTCNRHNFEFQTHGFLHIVPKEEVCITSHNLMRRSMVYGRILTAAFLWSLQ